jgi:endonuclease/exonuclease/phosphatase (EEP) superfamily protein YafD
MPLSFQIRFFFMVLLLQLLSYGLLAFASLWFLLARLPLPASMLFLKELAHVFWLQQGLACLLAAGLAALALYLQGNNAHKAQLWLLFAFSAVSSVVWLGSLQLRYPLNALYESAVQHTSNPNTSISVLQHNVFVFRNDFSDALALIKNHPSDIVALQEVGVPVLKALKQDTALHKLYPYHLGEETKELYLLSKWPLKAGPIYHRRWDRGIENAWAMAAEVSSPQGAFWVMVTHPSHPSKRTYYAEQQKMMAWLGETLPTLKGDLVVVGDLNITPNCPSLQTLIKAGHLQDPRLNQAWLPTWPRWMPPVGRLPLDHILLRQGMTPVGRLQLLPATGSDHLPIRLSFKLHNTL